MRRVKVPDVRFFSNCLQHFVFPLESIKNKLIAYIKLSNYNNWVEMKIFLSSQSVMIFVSHRLNSPLKVSLHLHRPTNLTWRRRRFDNFWLLFSRCLSVCEQSHRISSFEKCLTKTLYNNLHGKNFFLVTTQLNSLLNM